MADKEYTLDELKEIYFNPEYLELTNKYKDLFRLVVELCISGDRRFFDKERELLLLIKEVSIKTNVEYEKICMFGHLFEENIDLLHGIMNQYSSDHLYFIESNNFIKIGRSNDVKRRLGALQTDNPDKLRVKYIEHNAGIYETAIHRMFSYLRIRGEWFKKDNAIYDFIDTLQSRSVNKEDKYTPFADLGTTDLLKDF